MSNKVIHDADKHSGWEESIRSAFLNKRKTHPDESTQTRNPSSASSGMCDPKGVLQYQQLLRENSDILPFSLHKKKKRKKKKKKKNKNLALVFSNNQIMIFLLDFQFLLGDYEN